MKIQNCEEKKNCLHNVVAIVTSDLMEEELKLNDAWIPTIKKHNSRPVVLIVGIIMRIEMHQ